MAKSEEGEFELILGNRQLISVFLIVVVLLGVFFSMGYIVGRNSSAPAAEARNTAKPGPADSQIAESPASSTPDTAAKDPAPDSQAAQPSTPPETTHPATTHPATTHPEQAAVQKPAPLRTPAATAPEPVKAAPVTVAKSKPPAAGPPASGLASVTGKPGPGQYWQVVATSRPDAEIISEALAKKGFHSVVAPAPKEGIFRVLVGPFQDSSAQAQARTSLEAAGFKHPIIQRY